MPASVRQGVQELQLACACAPVRDAIHSSLVSTSCDRSAFVSTNFGTALPTPTVSDGAAGQRPVLAQQRCQPTEEVLGVAPARGRLGWSGRRSCHKPPIGWMNDAPTSCAPAANAGSAAASASRVRAAGRAQAGLQRGRTTRQPAPQLRLSDRLTPAADTARVHAGCTQEPKTDKTENIAVSQVGVPL